jgi:long-chain acyl-CoA synthetase
LSPDPAALEAAYATATELAVIAAAWPDRTALTLPTSGSVVTFAELEANVNRLARAFRARGLAPGDGLALLCSNRAEWIETYWATQRCGLRLIPVNWHLEAADVGYVISDSGARALVIEAQFAHLAGAADSAELRLAIGGEIPGFEAYERERDEQTPDLLDDPTLGSMMIYTSGTTGRPKGVRHPDPDGTTRSGARAITALFDFQPESGDVMLCTAPLYHSGPSRICNEWPLGSGIGVVLMDRFDAALVHKSWIWNR